MKYVRVMDKNTSNANGYEFKINEINVSDIWNPSENSPEKMGGFNFSTEDKVLRWLHRGDTIYDVVIPKDAEVVELDSPSCPHGVFRANKIIVQNPREITEDMVIDLYKKSDLPEETYYKCLVILLYRKHISAVKYIINDRINKDNINEAIKEFENYISDGKKFKHEDLWDDAKEIYDILIEVQKN